MKRDAVYYRSLVQYSDKCAAEFLSVYARMEALYEHHAERRDVAMESLMPGMDDPLGRMIVEHVSPARVYNAVETNIATLAHSEPKFALQGFPTRFAEKGVPLYERLVNTVFATSESFREVREQAIKDATLGGNGVIMTVCPVDEDAIPKEDTSDLDPLERGLKAQLDLEAGVTFATSPPEEVNKDFTGATVGMPGFFHVPLDQWVVDPTAETAETAAYIGRKLFLDEDVVRKQFPKFDGPVMEAENPIPQVGLCELYVRQPDQSYQLVYFALNGEDWVYRDKSDGLWIEHPYRVLKMHKGRRVWGTCELLPAYGAIKAERLIWDRTFSNLANIADDVVLLSGDTDFSEEKLDAATNVRGVTFLRVANGITNTPLSAMVHHLQRMPRVNESLALLSALERVFQLSSGVGPNQAGQVMKSETSATEADALRGYAQARATPKVRQVEGFMAGWAWDLIGTIAQYWDEEAIARIVGSQYAADWATVQLTRADVQRHVVMQVSPGSMLPVNETVRTQNAIQALGIANQDPSIRQLIDVRKFWEVIAAGLGFAKDSGFFLPSPAQVQPGAPGTPQAGAEGAQAAEPGGGGDPLQAILGAANGR